MTTGRARDRGRLPEHGAPGRRPRQAPSSRSPRPARVSGCRTAHPTCCPSAAARRSGPPGGCTPGWSARSLERGFYQGWDLHPAQLVSRYAATYGFFRAGLPGGLRAAGRLRGPGDERRPGGAGHGAGAGQLPDPRPGLRRDRRRRGGGRLRPGPARPGRAGCHWPPAPSGRDHHRTRHSQPGRREPGRREPGQPQSRQPQSHQPQSWSCNPQPCRPRLYRPPPCQQHRARQHHGAYQHYLPISPHPHRRPSWRRARRPPRAGGPRPAGGHAGRDPGRHGHRGRGSDHRGRALRARTRRSRRRPDAPVIELAEDEVLLPGLVDTHVHVNEPGRT